MASMTFEALTTSRTAPAAPPTRRLRPRPEADRGLRPVAHPARVAPPSRGLADAQVRSCTGTAAVRRDQEAAGWRLTERGLAVVVLTLVMIAVAAVAVIGLTALRVTSESYQPYGQSVLAR